MKRRDLYSIEHHILSSMINLGRALAYVSACYTLEQVICCNAWVAS